MMTMQTNMTNRKVTERSAARLAALLGALGALGLGGCATTQGGELTQDTFAARKKLTRELIARGDPATAFAYADGLQREHPGDAEVLVLRGVIYRDKGLGAEAEADLREAIRLDDKLAEAHAALAIAYDLGRQFEQSEPEHRRAVELAPRNARYLNNLGFSLFLRGKLSDAITFLGRAARLDPTNRRVRSNLGFAYAGTGDLRHAAHEFEMGGTAAQARNNLGFAYERRGDLPRADDLYREAARLDPASTRARANLAHTSVALGRELPSDAPSGPTGSGVSESPTGIDRRIETSLPFPSRKEIAP
jgi:Flp pilus assembly protein TadD